MYIILAVKSTSINIYKCRQSPSKFYDAETLRVF